MSDHASSRREGMRWGVAAMAGVVGGVILLVLQMLLEPVFVGGSPWGTPRMIAAVALGTEVLPPPETFDAGVFLTGVVLHLAMSALYGLALGAITHGMFLEMAVIMGAVFGLALYVVNFYLLTALFPWFAGSRNWVTVFSYIVFGLATGWILASRHTRRPAYTRL
ncbi:MAG TPA: hypothetical protein VK922_00050 [Gemmatimonadaceae bacterium]|nr:hypothetical protein [Gemmatimonadaceae bacterium]